MKEYSLTVNGRESRLHVEPGTPLLWVLRDKLGLTGTKYGCGSGLCGACTVHVDGRPMRACVVSIDSVAGKGILTIEGLSRDRSHPLQLAWIQEQVPQCGYCQSGMIMSAAALLRDHPNPTDGEIRAAMTNLCRCGTYPRVRRAILRAASRQRDLP